MGRNTVILAIIVLWALALGWVACLIIVQPPKPDCEPRNYEQHIWTNDSGRAVGVSTTEDSHIIYVEGC